MLKPMLIIMLIRLYLAYLYLILNIKAKINKLVIIKVVVKDKKVAKV